VQAYKVCIFKYFRHIGFFDQVISKAAFNQRRKTLRNALDLYKDQFDKIEDVSILTKRAETLSHEDFIGLAKAFQI